MEKNEEKVQRNVKHRQKFKETKLLYNVLLRCVEDKKHLMA
jgi:hypothetical protein